MREILTVVRVRVQFSIAVDVVSRFETLLTKIVEKQTHLSVIYFYFLDCFFG